LLDALSKHLASVEAKVENILMKLETYEDKLDELEQYSRSNCLVVHGTNIKTSKNYHSYVDAVISVLNDKLPLSYDICPKDIDILHPLPPNKKGQIPVIIKFIQRSIRNEVYAKKSSLVKTGITITESLTKRRLDLLKYAQAKLGFRNCWTSKGNIYCSIDGIKHSINNFHDIKALLS